jgi:hypothetical protein
MRRPQIFSREKVSWPAFVAFFALLCLVDYHYSTVNQIPSDGPLTRGFPLTFYWMVCPMSAGGAGACSSGMSIAGLVVDTALCMACALAAAAISARIARKKFARTRAFWIKTLVVFALTSLFASVIPLLQSAAHGRAIELGFPAVFLREYAGESWNAVNLAMDLVFWFAAALLCAAVFSRDKTDTSTSAATGK